MLSLVINPDSFEISESETGKSTQIFAEIYFQMGDEFFPEEAWNDFVAIVLNWWIDNALNMLNNNSKNSRSDFMDGPYYFDMELYGDKLLIHFIDDSCDDKKAVHCEEVYVVDFLEMLRKSANLVLSLAKDHPRPLLELTRLKANEDRISHFLSHETSNKQA
ncbi:MAG: hypothetical protein FWG75_06535 [Cystobacterineae bacterium]|nr:hypothetical protein [Cystobacterineae bacterium]